MRLPIQFVLSVPFLAMSVLRSQIPAGEMPSTALPSPAIRTRYRTLTIATTSTAARPVSFQRALLLPARRTADAHPVFVSAAGPAPTAAGGHASEQKPAAEPSLPAPYPFPAPTLPATPSPHLPII